jgi:hypothetical protein
VSLARRHGTFFLVDGLTEREFAEIQLDAVYPVERAYSRWVGGGGLLLVGPGRLGWLIGWFGD